MLPKYPGIEPIGEAAAFYVLAREGWIRRHVETLELLDDVTARRHRTIDITLPEAPSAIVQEREDDALYYVPVTLVAKHTPMASVDLRDEDGRALPLLTSSENTQVSASALKGAASVLRGRDVGQAVGTVLERVASASPDRALLDAAIVTYFAHVRRRLPTDHEAWPSFERFLIDLSANTALWIPLRGCPGEPRVVKFTFTVLWSQPRPPSRVPTYSTDVDGARLIVRPPVDTSPVRRSKMARPWRALGTKLGWIPVELEIDGLAIREETSYDLEVRAPPGLETRNIRTNADVAAPTGERLTPLRVVSSASSALSFAPGSVRFRGSAVVPLRIPATGFVTLSLLATALISAMLWAYAAKWDRAATQREVAAAVLVLVPALLAVFAIRTSEHALAARMLDGVRMSVLAAGVLASAAAAALAGVRPTAWGLETAAEVYAWLSLVPVAFLLTSYVCSLRPSARIWRWISRTAWSPLLGAALQAATVAAGIGVLVESPAWVAANKLLALAVLLGISAGAAAVIGATLRRAASPNVRWIVAMWTGALVVLLAAAADDVSRGFASRGSATTLREYASGAGVVGVSYVAACLCAWRAARA